MGLRETRHDASAEAVVLTTAALAAAFDEHAQEVYRRCLRATGNIAESEDLTSVVFFEAWRCRDRAVIVDYTLRPWLLGIAANVLRTSWRSKRRYHAALAAFHATNHDGTEPDHADVVAAAVDAAGLRDDIDAAFGQLGLRDRAVAELCLQQGMSVAQAAAELGLSESAVKSRLARSRATLRGLLQTGESSAIPSLTQPSGHQVGRRHVGAAAASGLTNQGLRP